MALLYGRVHTRVRLAVSVNLLDPGESRVAEKAITENVSPLGARVLVNTPKEPDTLLTLHSPTRKFRTSVRVVYCQPLPGGQFGIGLELQGASVNWSDKGMSGAASNPR